ncbi:heme exporter protein CcmD [Shewanella inventionis]|uniref:Heme exporter protein D n=1 Tax=Shewanella inventionis TaxID=1738770 RepID=A0ABQ1JQR5_9GAMM|nr:heme exporter protein CcmD [Shewanella inventionis]MCL1159674.1 heme exporter protein CcmD [Shewanella inventionis]UAL43881.1 heme exporter protein CcmD [Shewanella inventionis]GGB72285.1 heme exporter protein D [Shewanella inventionis]
MQFDSMSDFLNMGGYAFYVWLAYGVTFSSLAILIISSARRKRKVLTEIASKQAREEKLKESRGKKQ